MACAWPSSSLASDATPFPNPLINSAANETIPHSGNSASITSMGCRPSWFKIKSRCTDIGDPSALGSNAEDRGRMPSLAFGSSVISAGYGMRRRRISAFAIVGSLTKGNVGPRQARSDISRTASATRSISTVTTSSQLRSGSLISSKATSNSPEGRILISRSADRRCHSNCN